MPMRSTLICGRFLWVLTAELLLLVLASCAVVAPSSRPQFRLGNDARPLRYAVELVVVPEHDTFSGSATIELELAHPVSNLWLDGNNLIVDSARLEAGGEEIPTLVETDSNPYLEFAFRRSVGPGRARLHVTYRGTISDKDQGGLLRCQEGGNWYAFTHLWGFSARNVFPCFTEPGFKVPWQITLHVKREHLALANTPIVSETYEPNDMKCVRFAETQPLPCYVIGFAAGPFETVDLGKVGRKDTPLRIVVPKGQTSKAAFAAQAVPVWLCMLEDYCDTPFPYEKLDHVAIPDFPFSGMENAGLIMYRKPVLLVSPEQQTPNFERFCAFVAAHEMAHQWFGDLVTIAWWNDFWLKEAFAMLVSYRVLHQWNPDEHNAMSDKMIKNLPLIDRRTDNASCIRDPIQTEADITNKNLLYAIHQGAGVFMMFEAWVGEEAFRKSAQTFLRQYAGRNATTEDFTKTMSVETGQNLWTALSTFVDQPGFPLVKVQLKNGNEGQIILMLSQRRYRPVGFSRSPECMWRIPIQLRYYAEGEEKRIPVLLKERQAEVMLTAAPDTLKWLLVNEAAAGHYRVAYSVSMLQKLLCEGQEYLSVAERYGLVQDLRASVTSGEFALGDALVLLPQLLKDSEPRVVIEAGSILYDAQPLVPKSLISNYQRYVRTALEPIIRDARWQASCDENEKPRKLQLSLLKLMANHGEELSLVEDASRQVAAWLTDPNILDNGTAEAILSVAGRHCGRSLWEQLLDKARGSTDATHRWYLFTAVGSCRDPVLLNSALTALVTQQFQPWDAYALLEAACSQAENRVPVYEFVKQHFDPVMAALPDDMRNWSLTMIVQDFSYPELRADVERFLKDKDAELTGGAEGVASILENIDMACAFRNIHQKSLEDFLIGQ